MFSGIKRRRGCHRRGIGTERFATARIALYRALAPLGRLGGGGGEAGYIIRLANLARR